ncbi:MAG: hypothetical protein ABI488_05770 [Polyangiaceae bacterium]
MESINAKARIERMLENRFPEEQPGPRHDDLRIEFAYHRISGAVVELVYMRTRALKAPACTEFIEMIDAVLKDAGKALAVAHARLSSMPEAPGEPDLPRAAWSTAPLGGDTVDGPDFSDI